MSAISPADASPCPSPRLKVTVIGTGFVGLVTAACLADVGHEVVGLDIDERKVRVLQEGGIPFHEPGLAELISRNRCAGRLSFTTDVRFAVRHGRLQFIGVGTPAGPDGAADLQHVFAAAREIGMHMREYTVVVNKSTVPVGTAERVGRCIEAALLERGVQGAFSVVSNPEFLREGAAIEDFLHPARVIVGADDERALHLLQRLYEPLGLHRGQLQSMDVRSAELTKYAANVMLATRISFMNEMACLAERLGADIELVRQGIGSDPRIGPQFLRPGCGYGGSCFPKDIQALRHMGAQQGVEMGVLAAVEATNERHKRLLAEKVCARFGGDVRGLHFALWGLAFKPDTDDMREAPSATVIRELARRGATISAFDPVATGTARRALQGVEGLAFAGSAFEALRGADALVLVTEWREFGAADPQLVKELLRQPIVFDGRNLFDPARMRSAGLEYHPIGRGAAGRLQPTGGVLSADRRRDRLAAFPSAAAPLISPGQCNQPVPAGRPA